MKFLKFISLYPASLIYANISAFRNFLYDTNVLKSQSFDIPIIAIGNITVGGTGKTPMTEFLIEILRDEYTPAILSRGYKRKSSGFRIVSTNSTVAEVGDEPLQIKQKFKDIVVAVDKNRVNGINKIKEKHPEVDLIILDDAFQHRKVKPAISILLSDYNRPILTDHFLPYGNLRDGVKQVNRANVIIVTKTPQDVKPIKMRIHHRNLKIKPYQSLYFSAINYKELKPVFPGKNVLHTISGIQKKKTKILMVTGIATPQPLENHITGLGCEVQSLAFPDHHNFTSKDVSKIKDAFKGIKEDDKIIITTEKDAIRLREIEKNIDDDLKSVIYYIPIKVNFVNVTNEVFQEKLKAYIKKILSNKVPHFKQTWTAEI